MRREIVTVLIGLAGAILAACTSSLGTLSPSTNFVN